MSPQPAGGTAQSPIAGANPVGVGTGATASVGGGVPAGGPTAAPGNGGQSPIVGAPFSRSNPQQAQPEQGPYTPQMFSIGNVHNNSSGMQDSLSSSSDVALANEGSSVGRSSGILDFASGNPQDSPLYKSLLSSARSSIGNSYDQAVSNVRASAASRGFGYSDPSEQGMEAGTRAQEAGALSAAPSTALQETIAPELQAAGIDTTQAGMFAGQSASDLQNWVNLQQSRNTKDASLYGSFMNMIGQMAQGAGTAYAGG